MNKKRLLTTALSLLLGAAAHAQSPYIHKVYDYMPAPGQFVNALPQYESGDTQADMNRKVEDEIAGANHNSGMITLGGYGGYVVFGFDHEVQNLSGKYDFRILGNAFYANANPNGEATREGGSCEPGIVMVSRDENGNQLPDDPWYELAGSEYRRPQTIRDYRITYYRPDEDKPRLPHPSIPDINDIEYVRFTTNGHGDGYLFRNIHHSQPYYPLWAEGQTLSFAGAKLADNYADESGVGAYYVLYAYHWGYADNQPNANDRSAFNIEWAVDANGNQVSLTGIHFVKVYTAVNQYCGWLGETSTEISGAEDLHLAGQDIAVPVFVESISLNRSSAAIAPGETLALSATILPAGATNRAVTWKSDNAAVATVGASGLVAAQAEGQALIRAIANDGYYVASCLVTVAAAAVPPPPPPPGDVSGIQVSPASLYLYPGQMATLSAEVLPAGATNRAYQWSSSNTDVAEVTVNGIVFAVAPGLALVTATAAEGGYQASCLVTVSAGTPDAAYGTPAPPDLSYAQGTLRFAGLEGYDCRLYNLAGQLLQTFRISAPDEYRSLALPPGVYILNARRGEKEITLKRLFR
jgi:uncharacterized protein YjdB